MKQFFSLLLVIIAGNMASKIIVNIYYNRLNAWQAAKTEIAINKWLEENPGKTKDDYWMLWANKGTNIYE